MIEVEVDGKKVEVVTASSFREWRRRATIAFVFLTAVATGAAYIGYDASEDSDSGIRAEGEAAVARSCRDRLSLRITMAVALDDLRRAAVQPPETPAEKKAFREFIDRTQSPIESLLGEAAGRSVVTTGPIDERTIRRVRRDGLATCSVQAATFGDG